MMSMKMANLEPFEAVHEKNQLVIAEELKMFLFKAESDGSMKLAPAYNPEEMMKTFIQLKRLLALPTQSKLDFISMIANHYNGINGWVDEATHMTNDRYAIKERVSQFQVEPTLGVFSGKIAFRKELMECAIQGGYMDNVKASNLFASCACLPWSLKTILENCPTEVLAKGKTNLFKAIDKLARNDFFMNQTEAQVWKDQLNEQTKDYPQESSSIWKLITTLKSCFAPRPARSPRPH